MPWRWGKCRSISINEGGAGTNSLGLVGAEQHQSRCSLSPNKTFKSPGSIHILFERPRCRGDGANAEVSVSTKVVPVLTRLASWGQSNTKVDVHCHQIKLLRVPVQYTYYLSARDAVAMGQMQKYQYQRRWCRY